MRMCLCVCVCEMAFDIDAMLKCFQQTHMLENWCFLVPTIHNGKSTYLHTHTHTIPHSNVQHLFEIGFEDVKPARIWFQLYVMV